MGVAVRPGGRPTGRICRMFLYFWTDATHPKSWQSRMPGTRVSPSSPSGQIGRIGVTRICRPCGPARCRSLLLPAPPPAMGVARDGGLKHLAGRRVPARQRAAQPDRARPRPQDNAPHNRGATHPGARFGGVGNIERVKAGHCAPDVPQQPGTDATADGPADHAQPRRQAAVLENSPPPGGAARGAGRPAATGRPQATRDPCVE